MLNYFVTDEHRTCVVLAITLSSIAASVALAEDEYFDYEREHWAFVPIAACTTPTFEGEEYERWSRTPVDAFVLRQLVDRQLAPSPEAARAVLLRRLTFQLTGLPPTPQEVAAFVNDDAPDAYERLVDRLLASPHYGEHWAQHWLDVVRYAETEGFEYDAHRPGAWRFRDYVIQSLNDDKPYDQFVREQLAGDELTPNDHDSLVAAGFHRLGAVRRNAGNAEVAFSRNEVLTERTDAIGATFLAMTVGCARCHDHMFDPIRQTDYYRLQAFLASSFEYDVELADEDEKKAWRERSEAVEAEVKRLKDQLKDAPAEDEKRLLAELNAAQAKMPAPLPTISSVKHDPTQRTQIHLLERGDPDQPREPLKMRPLGVLLPEGTPGLPDDFATPRTYLADWIAAAKNPLTARVIVNRLWQYHLGAGLVTTPNDFGINGDLPSHPELLDYLANELVEGGWQLKPIHRLILLSSIYRQSSEYNDAFHDVDPNNRWIWRFNRRRLAANEIRDAMLAAAGTLNLKARGPSVIAPVDQELIDLLYKPSQWEVTPDEREYHRRSIYLIAKRNLRLPFMEVFDQPDLQTSCARRESSTHSPQALELLNGTLSNQLAEAFAVRLQLEAGASAEDQVELAYYLATGRPPSEGERVASISFLKEQPLREFALAMFNLNAFLYME
ncbi:MAG: DUF1549 domain-containing protein [Planctomycetaceae bacterium]|nr:DUF1549 domain-containing protein [Planctomycetales bacterium]MCB9927363.1 DUF1549 domain-containing protein [Planctomycetaceae bacterium]